MRPLAAFSRVFVGFLLLVLMAMPGAVCAQGIALGGVGPVNRAMAGAATAAPIDASGAIYMNPASISGLECSQMDIGIELLLPTETLSSSVTIPNVGVVAGSTGGEPGVTPVPTMAIVHKCCDSPWTLGLGMFGIAGFTSNYPASSLATSHNPVLLPQPSGLGRINSQAQFFQIIPTASYAITDKLSVGFAPTITMATFIADPLFLVPPDNAAGTGYQYPSGCGTRNNWGGGFQVGAYYITDNCWHLGFTFKSPQWFEPIRINTQDELGFPREESVRFDYPMVLSLGTAYSGFENWLFACDVRYFDYGHAAGFGTPAAFAPDGSVTGLGWKSIASVHLGAQYRVSDQLYVRMGYQYNDNPISSDTAFFNVASPLIIQHVVSTGLSYYMTSNLIVSLAYVHGFENEVTGPIVAPGVGPVPGTSVTSRVSADSAIAGFTLRF